MKLLSLLVLLFGLAGCVHAPPREATGLTAEVFWRDQALRRSRLSVISAKLRLRYEAHKDGVSGRGRLLTQLPSGLRLELRDPLGRVQYQVTIDGEQFAAYYPSQKRVYLDAKAGAEYMKRFLGVSFSFRDLHSLLMGILPDSFSGNALQGWDWDSGAGLYRARLEKNGVKLALGIDPDSAALRELTWESARDSARVTYQDFFPCCGSPLETNRPRLGGLVSVKLDKARSQVEAEWEDVVMVEPTKDGETFRPTLPADVKRVALP